mmetsp:Transcript_20398/g.30425  ORF Transcript_20398/g.30425 Transcript_20398/m.30425 type:complete len:213 (-) Transcript_20398:226-864(-)
MLYIDLLLLLLQHFPKISNEFKQPKLERFFKRPTFRNRERSSNAIKIAKCTSNTTSIALPSIDSIKSKLLHQTIIIKIHMHQLRWQDQLLTIVRRCTHEDGNLLGHLPAEKPNTIRLRRIHDEPKEVLLNIKGILQFERSNFQVFLLWQRTDDGSTEFKIRCQACSVIFVADSSNQDFLRAYDQIIWCDWKGGFCVGCRFIYFSRCSHQRRR